MDLNELKTLAAASLLAGSVTHRVSDHVVLCYPSKDQIKLAVKVSQDLWEEVLRQDREN